MWERILNISVKRQWEREFNAFILKDQWHAAGVQIQLPNWQGEGIVDSCSQAQIRG